MAEVTRMFAATARQEGDALVADVEGLHAHTFVRADEVPDFFSIEDVLKERLVEAVQVAAELDDSVTFVVRIYIDDPAYDENDPESVDQSQRFDAKHLGTVAA